MKILSKQLIRMGLWMVLLLVFAGCGGSESSTGANAKKVNTTLKTAGLLGGQTLGAVQLGISFPYGVTVELDPVTHEPTSKVVRLIGATDQTMVFQAVKYTAATPSTKGLLEFTIFNAAGFGAMEYVAVQLDITEGFFPNKSDFSITKFAVADIVNYQTTEITNFTFTVEII